MSDLISRQVAIDAIANCTNCGDEKTLRAYVAKHNLDNGWTGGVLDAIDAIEDLPSAQTEPCEDTVSRQRLLSDLKELVVAWEKYPVMAEQIKGVETAIGYVETIPTAQPERTWYPVTEPPNHHNNVIVRGIEAIGNVTVHKIMQWDVDTWRPTDYAPSIVWKEWSEI